MCDDESAGRWIPEIPLAYTLADGEEWVGSQSRRWREEHWANFAVTRAGESALVASCGLRVDVKTQTGDIGYLVHRGHRRQGIAAACVRLLTEWGLDGLGLARLQIRADVRNVGSRRTISASGYRFEGVVHRARVVHGEHVDDVLHALLPGDPRPGAGRAAPSGLGWPRLADGRLVVRPLEPDDAAAVQAACDDPDVAHWIYGLPAPYSLADAERFIADARHRLLLGERARLAICERAGGELLGSISLDLYVDREAGEIGYWVKKAARRRGVALAAARLVVPWAFNEVGAERLEILTYPGNAASQALADQLGFEREGVLRGFLAAEPGKSREGRVVPSADGSLPARDDQVRFALLHDAWRDAERYGHGRGGRIPTPGR